jgi:hypothetical protein
VSKHAGRHKGNPPEDTLAFGMLARDESGAWQGGEPDTDPEPSRRRPRAAYAAVAGLVVTVCAISSYLVFRVPSEVRLVGPSLSASPSAELTVDGSDSVRTLMVLSPGPTVTLPRTRVTVRAVKPTPVPGPTVTKWVAVPGPTHTVTRTISPSTHPEPAGTP